MKTKFWKSFVFLAILLGGGVAAQFGNSTDSAEAVVNIIFIVLAVLTLGWAFKLRKLEKKGIKDTSEIKNKIIE